MDINYENWIPNILDSIRHGHQLTIEIWSSIVRTNSLLRLGRLAFFFILSVWRCMAIKKGNIRVKHGNTFDTKKS
jgi:hypothetical protein